MSLKCDGRRNSALEEAGPGLKPVCSVNITKLSQREESLVLWHQSELLNNGNMLLEDESVAVLSLCQLLFIYLFWFIFRLYEVL